MHSCLVLSEIILEAIAVRSLKGENCENERKLVQKPSATEPARESGRVDSVGNKLKFKMFL